MDLKATEQGHSLLESELRKRKTPVCKAFLKNGKVVPATFIAKGKLPAREDVAASFPRTISEHAGAVLIAGKHATHAGRSKPKRIAVLFSGGPAAGGHNVIAGLKAALGRNTLLGVRNGPKGFLAGDLFTITDADVNRIMNTGGFDYLGTDRTKVDTQDQIRQARAICVKHKIDAIVVVGGDDSNANAAILAEHLMSGVKPNGSGVQVIGVPKTMDGDMRHTNLLPIPFGFDTATKVYSELVGNILGDAKSSRKYWHFIKLMGRDASHVALEVALQTHPNVTLIGEEIRQQSMSLNQIVHTVAHAVIQRASVGLHYGIVVMPEGLLEAIPEIGKLIGEISFVFAKHPEVHRMALEERGRFVSMRLSPGNVALLASLPSYLQAMLVADRDAHGNVTVSQIETDKLISDLVERRVRQLSPGTQFSANHHFFGYEGRCSAPTHFDSMIAYNLGICAASLALAGKTGYMACITDFEKGARPLALPLSGLMRREHRGDREELVIQKSFVSLDSPAFHQLANRRKAWMEHDCASSPGPIQFSGPTANQLPLTVALDQRYKSVRFKY